MTAAQNPYRLSEDEAQQYRGLLTQAFNAASSFVGSEETYEHLMASLISVETFVRTRNDGKIDETLEANFAKQAGFTNQQFYTVSGLLGHASNQVYGMLARLKDLKDVLNALRIGGAHIDYSEMVYVLTDEPFITGEEKSERTPQEFVKQPRLAILVKELQTIGIYTDDLLIRVGKVFEDKIRKLPYIIVEIPRLGKQVAVCDQYGETTFVSQNILEPYVWASYTKKQLKGLQGVQTVSYTDSWPFRICNLLAHGTDAMTSASSTHFQKVDVGEYERNRKKPRMELNEDIILNHALLYLKKYQEWPTISRETPVEGFSSEKWQNWNSALSLGTRGLPGQNSLTRLIKNFIIREAKEFKEKHGYLPLQHAGPLVSRPDITWELISKASSGTGRDNLHKIYTNAGLFKKRRVGKKEVQKFNFLTPEIIMQHALAKLDETWLWPDETMGETIPGVYQDSWAIWAAALWLGTRGLPGNTFLWKTIWDWVADNALQFHEREGHLPNPGSGAVAGYPGISWDIVDFGLRRQRNLRLSLETVLSIHLKDEAFLTKRVGVQTVSLNKFPSPGIG
ncbi:MAG TPA: hypothetical protein VIN59_01615 [Alphaproteobacteria bacterium]